MKKLFIGCLALLLLTTSPLQAYYQYYYEDGKIYYFDNKVSSDSGAGYLFWAAILSMNNPVILGVLGVIGGIGAITERDYSGGALAVGLGATELYLQTLPDRTVSNWLNGTIAGGTLLSVFFNGKEEYPPKKMQISPQILYREDIKLQYDEAKKIYSELADKGYIEATPYQAGITKKFNANEQIVLSESLAQFSKHVNWVLSQVSTYNQQGSNPNIIFSVPVKFKN
jgi:hypothetical protein